MTVVMKAGRVRTNVMNFCGEPAPRILHRPVDNAKRGRLASNARRVFTTKAAQQSLNVAEEKVFAFPRLLDDFFVRACPNDAFGSDPGR
jgi:hypothetical protein